MDLRGFSLEFRPIALLCGLACFANGQFVQQASAVAAVGTNSAPAMALSADGNTAVFDSLVYGRTNGAWTQQTGKLYPSSVSSVALSADGNMLLIGDGSDNSLLGSASVFTRSNGVWTQQGGKLLGTGVAGSSIQGWSVALSADGNTAVVGGYGDNDFKGAIWIFTRANGIWTQQGAKLIASGEVGAGRLGFSVAISGDGNTILAGAPYDAMHTGAVWVFNRTVGVWTQQGNKLVGTDAVGFSNQGWAVGISSDGNTAIFSAFSEDAAWVYIRTVGVWTQQGGKLVGVGGASGISSVAISADGNTAILGGPDNNPFVRALSQSVFVSLPVGSAWAFTRSNGEWTQLGTKFFGSGRGVKQRETVALSGDGQTVLLGGEPLSPDCPSPGNFCWNGGGTEWVFVRNPATLGTALISGNGAGDVETFRAQFSNPSGERFTNVYMLINSGFVTTNACYARYSVDDDSYYLANDGVTDWFGPLARGSSGTLRNSQCILRADTSRVTTSNPELTVDFDLTFLPSFNGARTVFLDGVTASSDTTWQNAGTWTVTLPTLWSQIFLSGNYPYGTPLKISPEFTSPGTAFSNVFLLVASGLVTSNSCYARYSAEEDAYYLADDSGTTWLGPILRGAVTTLQNSQCVLSAAIAQVTSAAVFATTHNFKVDFILTFKAAYVGAKIGFTDAITATGSDTNWQPLTSSFTIVAPNPPIIVYPRQQVPISGSGINLMFEAEFATNAPPVTEFFVLVNSGFVTANACYARYSATTDAFYLADNSGNTWLGPAARGTGGILHNQQCSLDANNSTFNAGATDFLSTFSLTFAPAFAGNKNIYTDGASNAADSGWVSAGTWTVPNGFAPTVVSVNPSSGTGRTQTFVVTISDASGPSTIGYVYLIVNSSLSGTNSCFVEYNRAANTIRLVNDSGLQWPAPVLLGTGSAMSNSQCTLNPATASATTSGNNLTINVPLSFLPAFEGGKSIFVSAYDVNGLTSGWQTVGTWNVFGTTPPLVQSVLPTGNVGSLVNTSVAVSDSLDPARISYVYFMVGTSISAANSCFVEYNHTSNTLRLVNDTGLVWPTPIPLGSGAAMSNSQCTLDPATASVTTLFRTLTVGIPLSFSSIYSGSKNVYVNVYDMDGLSSGWVLVQSWTIGPPRTPKIENIGMTGGPVGPVLFNLTVSDSSGASFIGYTYFLINNSLNGANACFVEYNHSSHAVRLANDSGLVWPTPVQLGTGSAMSNSQCTLDPTGASVTASGQRLTINIPLRFSVSFAGSKQLFASNYDISGTGSGWQPLGFYNIGTPVPAVLPVSPSSGSGTSQSFLVTVQYPNGASLITYVYVLINSSLTGANSCFIEYNRSANTIRLVDDSGLQWPTPVLLGTGSPMSNSQCTLNPALASSSSIGNNLSISLPLTFASSGYSGIKQVFVSAFDSEGAASGWQIGGAWTVP